MPSNDLHDDDLRARFVRLRREEEAGVPGFTVPAQGTSRPGQRFIGLAVAAAAVAIALTLVVLPFGHRKPPGGRGQPSVALAQWKAPTDFLLETPGRELLRTVPTIGDWRGYAMNSGSRPKHPQSRKQVLP